MCKSDQSERTFVYTSIIIIAPQGHFRRAGRYDMVGFQCVLRTVGRVGSDSWGRVGGWLDECATRHDPSIREARGTVSVGPFPSRNFGGRTAVMVRSVLH